MTTIDKASAAALSKDDHLQLMLLDEHLAHLATRAELVRAQQAAAMAARQSFVATIQRDYALADDDNVDGQTGAITRRAGPPTVTTTPPASPALPTSG